MRCTARLPSNLASRIRSPSFPADPTYANAGREVYSNGNPFLFNGRIVIKTGESAYDIYDGDVTSCQLPKA